MTEVAAGKPVDAGTSPHPRTRSQTPAVGVRTSPWVYAGLAFALAAAALPLYAGRSAVVQTLAITFASIVLEALPFVMLGSLLGGLIEVFISRERLTQLIPRQRTLAILSAGLLGLVLPICECAVIPVTRRLVRKGIPFSVAVAYLIAGPIVNPIVAASTWVAYAGDWLVVLARLVCGFAIAVFVAVVIDELFPDSQALRKDAVEHTGHDHDCCGAGGDHGQVPGHDHAAEKEPSLFGRLLHSGEHAADDFLHVSQFLVVGAFFAAASQALITRQAFVDVAGTPAVGIGLMMTLAVILNLCSEADAFVAASFRTLMPLSAQMAFMVLGPMLDLKLIAMYLSFVRKRALVVMITLMVLLVFGMMMTLHYFAWSQPGVAA